MRVIDGWSTKKKEEPNNGLGVIEGYPGEIEVKIKQRAREYKYGMERAAAEEQRAQTEKNYAQESKYSGGFGSGSAYMAGEKPEKTMDTGFSGGQRGGFGANRVQNELQAVNLKLAEAMYNQAGYFKKVAAGEAEPFWQLVKQKKELDKQYSAARPTPLRRAVNFVGDAMDAVVRASPAAAFSGMEQAHSYVEALANRAAAWALRDLSNAQVLKLPSTKPFAEKMRDLADRMATEVDYTKAQQWQDYYQSVMDEVMDGHSDAGKWVLDKVAAAGTAAFDKGVSLVTGVPVLPIMGVRAGGNAATRAHNKGATDAQALAIGLETAAVEMATEKLFGGNPMYDTDAGVVNTLVGKLTGSESVMRVLDSTAFNIAAEGVEEVIAELGEAPFEGLILNKTAKGTVSKESLGDAFLGGVFLAGMARINGYVMGTSAALDEAHTRHYAEILAEEAGKSNDSNVQRAATELQDQLDFGSAPTEKDVGHLVSVLDKAGETNVVDNVIREVEQQSAKEDWKNVVEDTAINDDPEKHTVQQQVRIEEYKRSVDTNLMSFYQEAKINQGRGTYRLHPVSERAAQDIIQLTGQDVRGFNTALDMRQAWHINNDHGINGKADHSMANDADVARMQYVLDNYDFVEYGGSTDAYWETKANGRNRRAPVVVFSKKVNGTYYVVEAVPVTKAKTVNIVSAYMLEEGKVPPGPNRKK